MNNKIIKELHKFFRELKSEDAALWCDALNSVSRFDSPENSEAMAEDGYAQIENQTEISRNSLDSVELDTPTIVAGTIKQSVDELVLTKQSQVLDALQTAASTANEQTKVANLEDLNNAGSLFDSIRNTVQPGAISMIFAVFSRKNDGYGLG